jgi:hypothetical protein
MQFRDLKAQYQALKPEIDEGIQAVIDSSAFILGKPVTELRISWLSMLEENTVLRVVMAQTLYSLH